MDKPSPKDPGGKQAEFERTVRKMARELVKESMDVATVAWRTGVAAYMDGKGRGENPVRGEDTDAETARLAWDAGWDAGKAEMGRRLETTQHADDPVKKPSPEENVECRPGKDTVCGVCGETIRWIERKFPELSGWEECRFHLAAPKMYEACLAAQRYDDSILGKCARGETKITDQGLGYHDTQDLDNLYSDWMLKVRAVMDEVDGGDVKCRTFRFGPKDKFWAVTDPTPRSELCDILFEASLADLIRLAKGGWLPVEESPMVFTDRAEAETEAKRRLQERDQAQ